MRTPGFRHAAKSTLLAMCGVACAIGIVLAAGCTRKHPDQRTLRVAVAANMQFAFEDLKAQFQKAHPDIAVEAAYGSSGNFVAQITNGARFDLFLSADTGYPQKLIEGGAADKADEFHYAVGRLVLWVRSDSAVKLESGDLNILTSDAVRKIAMANPQHAPYGRAAEAAITKAGVYDKVKGKIVFGEDVGKTAQFVESGSADIGLIPLSLAVASQMKGKGTYQEIPQALYPAVEQSGLILKAAKDRPAAEQLRDFILSAAGKTTLKQFGFSPPGE